jgi:hypothetical protein
MSEEPSWGPGSGPARSDGAFARESDSEDEQGEEPDLSIEETEGDSEAAGEPQRELGESQRFAGSVDSVLRPGEYAFLPVFGFNESNIAARKYALEYGFEDDSSVINIREDEPLMIGGKELTWWEDESIMPKHPFMLVNPLGFASVDPDLHNFRDVFRVAKGEHFVFSDSGGYQLMSMTGEGNTEEAKIVESRSEHSFTDYMIYPERLVEWQVENADAGATIDYPPYNISGASNFPDAVEHTREWQDFFEMRRDKSADMTLRMAERLAELREDGNSQAEDYIFTPVIHGKPNPEGFRHKYVRDWHHSMEAMTDMAGIEPRGWVLKPEPAKSYGQIAMFLGYASEYLQDADYIHVLMVGGLLQKSLLMYYAKKSDHFVTSDASSYAAGGKRRQFDLPKTATRRSVIISSRDDDEDNAATNPNRLDRYPCRCSVCSTVDQEIGFKFVTQGSGSARSVSLNLHNLQQTLNVERTLDALLREEDATIVETGGDPTGSEFWRYVKTVARDKSIRDLYRAMDYVRLAVDEGLDKANDTYRIKWEQEDGMTIDRGQESAAEANW